jgi:WhiB family redox-sensing transcriptional regulator
VTSTFFWTLITLPLALAEFAPWCGWLAPRLIPCAAYVRYGRGEMARTRSREWLGQLDKIPAPISQLVYVLGLLFSGLLLPRMTSISATASNVVELVTSDPDLDFEIEWQDRALCASEDPDAFFPEKGGSVQAAKRVCLQCTVRVECLEYALTHDKRFGVWGGLSERERRRLRDPA